MTTEQQVAQWKADNLHHIVRCPNNAKLSKEECVKQQVKATRKTKWVNGARSSHCRDCGTYQGKEGLVK